MVALFPQESMDFFYTHVQDSSEKCDKVNVMKNDKTLGTRLVMRYLFHPLCSYSNEYIHLSDGLQKNLQNEKLKGSENQTSTTGFTVIKVHNYVANSNS